MIFCGSASGSAATGGSVVEAGSADSTGAGASTGGGSGVSTATAFGGSTGSGIARIREIGGRNVRFVFPPSSGRFARGFFSSINETVSITGFNGGVGAAETSATSFATRALEATAAADARPAFVAGSDFALTSFRLGAGATTGAAALTVFRADDVDVLRAAVLLVVRVGICVRKNLLGDRSAQPFALLRDCFLVDGVVNLLRFRFVYGEDFH